FIYIIFRMIYNITMRTKAKILVTLAVAAVLLAPGGVWGDDRAGAGLGPGSGSQNLPNPLGKITDPRVLIGIVINSVLGLVGSIAFVVFIAGGIIWMTSAGNSDKIQKGKNMIIWAALGLAVIFFSYAIVRFILEDVLTKAAK
ncbi:MAG: hypothetical protein AABZ06_09090, partial [Bdellovibrionota bacterium]